MSDHKPIPTLRLDQVNVTLPPRKAVQNRPS
jgi:hypothetical protein